MAFRKDAVARFVIRMEDGEPRLGVLIAMRGQKYLKSGRVYEIAPVLMDEEVLEIKDIGPSCIPKTMAPEDGGEGIMRGVVCWANALGYVVECGSPYVCATREEYKAACGPPREPGED